MYLFLQHPTNRAKRARGVFDKNIFGFCSQLFNLCVQFTKTHCRCLQIVGQLFSVKMNCSSRCVFAFVTLVQKIYCSKFYNFNKSSVFDISYFKNIDTYIITTSKLIHSILLCCFVIQGFIVSAEQVPETVLCNYTKMQEQNHQHSCLILPGNF